LRSRYLAILALLVLFLMFALASRDQASGQSDSGSDPGQRLLEAFLSVQEADRSGVPPYEIASLVDDLNTALGLQESDPTLSISVSARVSSQARGLQADTASQSLRILVLTYSTAFWAAGGSSLLAVEFHRVLNLARKSRVKKLRILPRTGKA